MRLSLESLRRLLFSLAWFLLISFCWCNLAQGEETAARKTATHDLEDITVTATKTNLSKDLVPFTTHTVTRKEIEIKPEPAISNIGELVRDVPGVQVNQVYPLGPPWISLRGTGYFIGRTVYLLDGLPLMEPLMSTTISPNDVERIEVLSGPSSALYGPNASGGVINVITRRGGSNHSFQANAAYGSMNTNRFHADLSGQASKWHYYLSYSSDSADGYKYFPVEAAMELYRTARTGYLGSATLENARYRKEFIAAKTGFENLHGASFWVGVNYLDGYQHGGQPSRISDDHGKQAAVTAVFETPLGSHGRLKASAGYQFFERPSLTPVGLTYSAAKGVTMNPKLSQYSDGTPREFVPFEVQADLYLGPHNTLTVGYFRSYLDQKTNTYNAQTGVNVSSSRWSVDQEAVYFQDQMFLLDDRLILMFGARRDQWRYYDIYDSASTPTDRDSFTKSETTYRGGLKYRIDDHLALRTAAGTAFWPGAAIWFISNSKTATQWREANPDLKPEKTWMYEVGLDYNRPDWGTDFSATFYYGEITDMATYTYAQHPTLANVQIVKARNVGEAEIYGLELSLKQRLIKDLYFLGSLTLNHSRITKDEYRRENVGHQIMLSPDYSGSVGLRYQNPDLVNAEATLRFSDFRYYDNDNTDLPYFKMKAFKTVDARIWRDWKITDNLVLTTQLTGVNVFGEEYELGPFCLAPEPYYEGFLGLKFKVP
ncbi:MAG: TonB-dependent receptor [Thermodesulfobacteriota bacterium]